MATNHDDTTAVLALCLAANVPVLMWGPPGQGKTSAVQEIARNLGLHLETIIASIREPSDFAGLPVINPLTGAVDLAAPGWAKRLVSAAEGNSPDGVVKDGIAFYDEISTAPPAVQAAMLRPILEGVVGDVTLPTGTRTIAAANPPDQAADGWDLSAPNANRFVHMDWVLDAQVVADGFSVGWPVITVPNPNPEVVDRLFVEAKILVGTFVRVRSELLTRVPTSSDEAGRAWPSPRSWEMAAKVYSFAKASNANTNVINLLVAGCVGGAAASEFLQFAENLDLPDPEKLLANPDSLTVPSDRADKVYAISASVWAATKSNMTIERWVACGRILGKIAEAGRADIAFVAGQRWAKDRPEGGLPSNDTVKALGPILMELGKLTK